jgi:hypothetical protein
MSSPEYFKSEATGWREAIVVHLIAEVRGPRGEPLKVGTGEVHDNESTVDLTNPRVFCEACRVKADRALHDG